MVLITSYVFGDKRTINLSHFNANSASEDVKTANDSTNSLSTSQILTYADVLFALDLPEHCFPDVFISCGGKPISENRILSKNDHVIATIKGRGGKGGFGSMLRSIGAQIEKTTNNEACRDLSGRRLRDINEEKRLKKFLAKKVEREKELMEQKRKRLKRLEENSKHIFEDQTYFDQREQREIDLCASVDKVSTIGECSKSALSTADNIAKESSTVPNRKKRFLDDLDESSEESDQDDLPKTST